MDLFDKLVLSMPIKDFIKQGYLAPYKYFSFKNDSDIQKTIDDIELDRFGEYKEASMEEKMDIGSIRAQLLDSYLSLAEGKKGIIYAINIVHAKHICEEYMNAGYKAVSIDSKDHRGQKLLSTLKRSIVIPIFCNMIYDHKGQELLSTLKRSIIIPIPCNLIYHYLKLIETQTNISLFIKNISSTLLLYNLTQYKKENR